MPYLDPEKRKNHSETYGRDWYQRNKEKVKAKAAKNRRDNKDKFLAYKASLSCAHCGFSHPAVIDFHHIDRTDKRDLNRLIANNQYKAVYEEIKKCIPLCSNCHRIVHWDEHQATKEENQKRWVEKHGSVLPTPVASED